MSGVASQCADAADVFGDSDANFQLPRSSVRAMGMKTGTTMMLGAFVASVMQHVHSRASALCDIRGKKTISSSDVKEAIRHTNDLVFSPSLALTIVGDTAVKTQSTKKKAVPEDAKARTE